MHFGRMAGAVAAMILGGTVLVACGSNSTGNTANVASVKKTAVIGYTNGDAEDVAVTYLWKDLLQKHGYKVTLDELDAGPLFEGNYTDAINLNPDVWMPVTLKAYMQKYGSNLTDLGKWYVGTDEGFVVPQYVKNVNTISELEDHASEFHDQIVGIDAGSGEMAQAQKAVSAYGLKDFHLIESSSPAMLVALKRAYAAKEPIVVTLWSPDWPFGVYKLKYLSDPKHMFGTVGWIQTEANKTWAKQNPQVVKWMGKFKVSPEVFSELLADIQQNPNSPSVGVKKWIGSNETLVNSWFK